MYMYHNVTSQLQIILVLVWQSYLSYNFQNVLARLFLFWAVVKKNSVSRLCESLDRLVNKIHIMILSHTNQQCW